MQVDKDDDDEEEQPPERVTAESYGSLDTANVMDECWLIRVPTKLYEQWCDHPEGTDLGELVFCKGVGKPIHQNHSNNSNNINNNNTASSIKPSLTIQVNERSIATNTNVPFKYSLSAMTKKIPAMHPFVRNPNTGVCTLLGTITRTANLQAEQTDSKYRAMLKDRLAATTLREKGFVKPTENPATVTASTASVPSGTKNRSFNNKKRSFGNAVSEFGQRKLEAQDAVPTTATTSHAAAMPPHVESSSMTNQNKKSRQFAADESVRSVLFALFGMERYWTLKDLKNAALAGGFDMNKKAEAEMRELLRNELAVFHRAGDHKNQWELKEEFRQQDNHDAKDGTA